MLLGIGFVTVITASITGAFVEQTRKKQATGERTHSQAPFQDISALFNRIEAKVNHPS